ncbi:amino acid adenylation domain-containing protein [Streptomyces sp. ICBB 8177]|uniref:non-ribosomal peptide synthetase n=1 Tax=Streptomyces sp. ICBB 8177 TaxID=563922 RepID=UPI001F53F713|nr:amino acid adenylation domain-containing protein [Streptomyces sp. ICBB 8177]
MSVGPGQMAEEIHKAVPALQFPVTGSRPERGAPEFGVVSWSGQEVRQLSAFVAERGLSAVDLFRAAFAVLLHRYSGQDDLTLLHLAPDDAGTCRATPVRSRVADHTPFSALTAALASRRRKLVAEEPLPPLTDLLGDGLHAGFLQGSVCQEGSVAEEHPAWAELHLLLAVEDGAGGPAFALRYDCALFTPAFISRLAANYRALLLDACARPAADIRELDILSPQERGLLVAGIGARALEYDREACVHRLVEAQADRTPRAPAVEYAGRTLDYAELDASANRLARALRQLGAVHGGRIGVSVSRTERMVCLLLAIHKAGCAYVPLDPSYPADRLGAIAAGADMSLVVYDTADAPRWLTRTGLPGVPLAQLWDAALEEDPARPEPVDAGTPTHLIHTSGSTGAPKGVVITHRNVTALLAWAHDTYSREELSRVLFGTSLNFDLSVFELWAPLTTGGTVVVAENVLALTEDASLAPTLVNTVPSALSVLLRRAAIPDSVSVVNVAGEPLPGELVDGVLSGTRAGRVFNLYGPSEDTTYSTGRCFTAPGTPRPTIGTPLPNTRVHLLDDAGRLVPYGVTGEIHLSGDGLAAGYSGDPERTAAAFIEPPAELAGTGRLYRTGDLARWTPDGELDFLGRRDNQVKVRGYRIELGEIEAAARRLAGVDDVAAVVVRAGGEQRIVAYVADAHAGLAPDRVAAHLETQLPHYMRPARVVVEPRLPRLPNGKTDRKALGARPVDWGEAGAGELTDPFQVRIGAVWAELLGVAAPGPGLDFFSVGGHSLLANLLAARLTDLAGRPVRVAEVYAHRTIAEQARLLKDSPFEPGGTDRTVIGTVLRESTTGHGVPGAGAAFFVDGTVEYAYQGHADLERDVPYTAVTRQRMTCVTKVLIACVALMLVDRGLLELDAPLAPLLPEGFRRRDGNTAEVTLRQLLSHTSGIDDSWEVWHDIDQPDLTGYVTGFRDYQQLFDPGTIFAYSACGTSVVALLIERVTGAPWRRAVNEMLLSPLGIKRIPETNDPGDHYGDEVATGYLWHADDKRYQRFEPGPQTVADDAASSFAVCFTTEDLVALARFALDDGATPDGRRLLSRELATAMRTPQIDIPGHHFMHAWGLGWLLFGPSAFGFNSNGSGHHNFIQVFPEQGAFLILLANAYPAFGVYEDLIQSLTGERLIRTGRPFDLALDDCAGRYECDGYRLDVTRGQQRLEYAYHERARDGSWTPLDEGELVLTGAGGFSSMSERNILAGSISFIPAPGTKDPAFVRMGQRVAAKVR